MTEALQELLDQINEKILFLRRKKITEASHLIIFQLDKEIEELENEISKITQQIENLGTSPCSEELYRALLKLGYREQVLSFKKLIKAQSIAAFLIHGLPDHGQRWLLNRLVTQYVRYSTIGKVVRVELARIGRRRDINALWRELGGRVGLGKQSSPEEIAERVYQWWQTQNVFLVFHDVDCMPKGYLQEFIGDFWLPLATQAREKFERTHKFQLLMFLVDYEGCVDTQDTLFAEQQEQTWEPKVPLKLPSISAFGDRVLIDWIETVEMEFDKLPLIEVIHQMENLAHVILENSDCGIPELAMSEICRLCECNWYEEKERWLKL